MNTDTLTMQPSIPTVAVVGTGVIGRSWARVFARAGCRTRLYDPDALQVEKALAWWEQDLELEHAAGLLTADVARARRARVSAHQDLAQALAGAGYVQESGPEQMETKKAIYAQLDRAADPAAILASSTSALDVTEVAAGLSGARRCIVAHPVNPPHLIPVVEVLPGHDTAPDVVARTRTFLSSVGQTPVILQRYVPGFLLNRMQAALLREAIHLVETGVADVDDVDAVIRDGLGLRWALMGPFAVANTNADGGVREYFKRYGSAYRELMNNLGPTPSFSPELIEQLGRATEAMVNQTPPAELCRWRDRMIRKLRALKDEDPQPC